MDNPEVRRILRAMSFDFDIVIAGGGLNGPALALGLAQAGFSVAVVDARPERERASDNFDGRGYALALASKRLLSAIGVWQACGPNAQPMLDIKVSDGRAGEGPSPFFLHFDHTEIEEGPMGFMLEDRFLYRAFQEALAETSGIELISEDSVVDQRLIAGGTSVTLASEREISARLLVGCDGRQRASRSGPASREPAGDISRPPWSVRLTMNCRTTVWRISFSCRQGLWPFCRCREIAALLSGQKRRRTPLPFTR